MPATAPIVMSSEIGNAEGDFEAPSQGWPYQTVMLRSTKKLCAQMDPTDAGSGDRNDGDLAVVIDWKDHRSIGRKPSRVPVSYPPTGELSASQAEDCAGPPRDHHKAYCS